MTEQTPVTFTQNAAKQVKSMLEKQNKQGYGLRIKVLGGGCAGYQYKMDIEEKPSEKDKVLEFYGIKIFLDPKTALFIKGTEIDYVEDLMQSGFRFKNPNSTGSCSCGESFSA
ncbi:MAG: iron-sulfur cluster assembly accessory protein [Deltaproteobacteria bacterium]|nr:iron-sulfur cluster assembly accessory protein [Deltaproteobacteria bacterium]